MKYVIGGVGVVVFLAIFIGIIFAIINRGDDDPQLDDSALVLSDSIEQNSEVEYIIYGRIIADEEFRAVRFRVNQQRRVMDVLSGYNLAIENRYEFPNTAASYEAFLFALENNGYLRKRSSEHDSEKGQCSNGRRYTYEVRIDGNIEHRAWSTSCRAIGGTFDGQTRSIERLFKAQIPEYRDLTRQTRL